MAASYSGGEVKFTRRYQFGKLLGRCWRNLLLMSATPHNGKEEGARTALAYLQEKAPPVYDPFSGGGSISQEAQRLGSGMGVFSRYAKVRNPTTRR